MPTFKPALLLLAITWICCGVADPTEHTGSHDPLGLSPALRALLQAEMQQLAAANEAAATAIASGDWKSLQHISEKMRDSYVMKQQLTDTQKHELAEKLPARFKRLDSAFHARADSLRRAAADQVAELAAFHYYRLLESCAGCHAEYATARFPGFSPEPTDDGRDTAEHHH